MSDDLNKLADRLYKEILKGTYDCKVIVGGKELDPWHVQLRNTALNGGKEWDYTKEEAQQMLREIAVKLVAQLREGFDGIMDWEMVKEVAHYHFGSGVSGQKDK